MKPRNYLLMWVGIGLAMGAGLGVVFEQVPLGVGLGLAVGVAIGLIQRKRNQSNNDS